MIASVAYMAIALCAHLTFVGRKGTRASPVLCACTTVPFGLVSMAVAALLSLGQKRSITSSSLDYDAAAACLKDWSLGETGNLASLDKATSRGEKGLVFRGEKGGRHRVPFAQPLSPVPLESAKVGR